MPALQSEAHGMFFAARQSACNSSANLNFCPQSAAQPAYSRFAASQKGLTPLLRQADPHPCSFAGSKGLSGFLKAPCNNRFRVFCEETFWRG